MELTTWSNNLDRNKDDINDGSTGNDRRHLIMTIDKD